MLVRADVGTEPGAPSFAGMGVSVQAIVSALSSAAPVRIKPVGTSSVVFKMDLAGDIDAAFKPRTRRHPQGHLAEVAAFRIARALGMDNVAPAVPRTFSLDRLRALLDPDYAGAWDTLALDMVADAEGRVAGVAIYWIPALREIGIDTKIGMGQWRRWLSQAQNDPPSREKSKLIAEQVSRMVAFDYLIGNWDRFSGANAQGDESGRRVFVRDHNVAFMHPLPASQHARLIERLRLIERFSRGFIARLKTLDDATLRRALHDPTDAPGYAALTESQIAGVLDRRTALLSYIAALLDRYGEDNVLTFP